MEISLKTDEKKEDQLMEEPSSAKDQIHSGHRQRVKEEYLKSGIENFSDVRALEMLLFYGIQRKDTNPLAHALLDRFGSLQNVFSASVPELTAAGIPEHAAILINLVPGLARKAILEKEEKELKYFKNSGEIGKYIQSCFIADRDERFMIYCLDASLKLLSRKEVSHGVVNKVNVDIRRIAEIALTSKCTSCIVAHNHPDGIPEPSKDDILVTDRIRDALATVGIRLNDHFIVCNDSYYSFAEHSLL
ncbi:MAG: DNA repair protein RadC [Eubacteriales bacterium]|nr:DNA repair protein RadC [Eubacteriales bacterium]